MGKYLCVNKCYHGKLYRRGEHAIFNKDSDGPQNHKGELIHFERVDKPVEKDEDVKKKPGRPPKIDSIVKVNGKDI